MLLTYTLTSFFQSLLSKSRPITCDCSYISLLIQNKNKNKNKNIKIK